MLYVRVQKPTFSTSRICWTGSVSSRQDCKVWASCLTPSSSSPTERDAGIDHKHLRIHGPVWRGHSYMLDFQLLGQYDSSRFRSDDVKMIIWNTHLHLCTVWNYRIPKKILEFCCIRPLATVIRFVEPLMPHFKVPIRRDAPGLYHDLTAFPMLGLENTSKRNRF